MAKQKVTTLSSVWTIDRERNVFTREPRIKGGTHPYIGYEPGEHEFVDASDVAVGESLWITPKGKPTLRSGRIESVEDVD